MSTAHYYRASKEAIAAGTWLPAVPVETVAAHIDALCAAGCRVKWIAGQARVSVSVVSSIRSRRRSQFVPGQVASGILSVRLVAQAAILAGHVDGTGTASRMRALACLGYSVREQARLLDGSPRTVQAWIRAETPTVDARTAERVPRLYDRLSMTPAPTSGRATFVRNWAASQGWVPPLAWDDDTIDDPSAAPQGVAEPVAAEPDELDARLLVWGVRAHDAPPLTPGPRAEVLRRLHADGEPVWRMAEWLGMQQSTVSRALLRMGLRTVDP